jgi:hypothetical protein
MQCIFPRKWRLRDIPPTVGKVDKVRPGIMENFIDCAILHLPTLCLAFHIPVVERRCVYIWRSSTSPTGDWKHQETIWEVAGTSCSLRLCPPAFLRFKNDGTATKNTLIWTHWTWF